MLLIDALDARSDSVKIVESVTDIWARYTESRWFINLDGAEYEVSESALEILLNILKIPIKYVYRCVKDGGVGLAEQTLNYWLSRYNNLSFLVQKEEQDPIITQVYSGSKLYLPSVQVNDLILEHLKYAADISAYEVHEDIFNAVYLTKEEVTIFDDTYVIGVRVLYSDCFTITPRFDGVLYSQSTGALFSWPTLGKKFRVAQSTIPQVTEQIENFLEMSLTGVKEELIPHLKKYETDILIDAEGFIARLCSDLRYSHRVKKELLERCTKYSNHFPKELLLSISQYTTALPEDSDITIEMARDIQIALSTYVVKGCFK